jgi:bifunctional non-homologous end joining protein LigD
VTHLDKVLWPATRGLPAYTRRDYLRYLLATAPHLLAHLRDRPLTLVRQPAGVTGRRFVHFHYEQPLPEFVETIDIHSQKSGGARQFLLCNNAATLIWLAHVGCLEFHGWHSRADASDTQGAGSDYSSSLAALERSALEFPDYIVCDLDPYIYAGTEAAGASPEFSRAAFERCKEAALALKRVLDSMALRSIVKTSGKTGLHVLVPIGRTIRFEAARAIATELGRHLMALEPRLITMEQSVARRSGRIFFDAGMNARVKTLAAPYSVRGVVGAPVAMPVEWEVLPGIAPFDYTMANVPRILERRGDVWSGIEKQDVAAVLRAGP